MVNRLALVGDFFNLGDAFLAEVEAIELRKQCADANIIVAPYRDPSEEMKLHFEKQGIHILAIRKKPISFLMACIGSELFIGGGHAVRETVSFGWLFLVLAGTSLANCTGGSSKVIAAGVTALRTRSKTKLWGLILRKCKTIRLRDRVSAMTLARIFPKLTLRTEVTSDIAFLASMPAQTQRSAGKGVCIVSPAIDDRESRNLNASRLLGLIYELKGRGVIDELIFIAHDVRNGMDATLCEELSILASKNLDIPISIAGGDAGNRLITTYSSADLIITGRLHGLIIGALLGRPVICIGDITGKLSSFAERFDYPSMLLTGAEDAPSQYIEVDHIVNYLKHFNQSSSLKSLEKLHEEAQANLDSSDNCH